MNRDRWSSNYDDIFTSDRSGYPGAEVEWRSNEQTHPESDGPNAWRQQQRQRQGPVHPDATARRRERSLRRDAAWMDEPLAQRSYGPPRPYEHDFANVEGDDETSGYAQGYDGYGQGQSDAGPQRRLRGHELETGYGRYRTSTQGRTPYPAHGPHRGKGPRNYKRSDDRIRDDVCEALMLDPWLDASRMDVVVREGIVTLEGSVAERYMKYLAEDCAAHATGVQDVENHIRLDRLAAIDQPGPSAPLPE